MPIVLNSGNLSFLEAAGSVIREGGDYLSTVYSFVMLAVASLLLMEMQNEWRQRITYDMIYDIANCNWVNTRWQ